MSQDSKDSTSGIVEAQLDAFRNKDIDGMMRCYAEDAALFHPDGLVVGKDNIRDWMSQAMEPLPADLFRKYTITLHEVHGDVAYTTFTWEGVSQPGTDTFVVRDGLIVAQTAFFSPV